MNPLNFRLLASLVTRSRVLLCCFLSLLVTTTNAWADSAATATATATEVKTLAELQTTLSHQAIIRGDFTQTRTMEMFDQPLLSQGTFLLDKENGLLWNQTTPFPVHLVLTDNKLSQRFGEQPAQVITDKENPMAFYFSHIFLSVFHGDTQKLTEQFSLDFSPSDVDANWTLSLTPKHAPMNAVFERIVLQGKLDIERIELKEIRGDSTLIEFSNFNHQPQRLTDDEAQQFQL
jgi:outer membrane lipoprotein-sorting protein